MLMWKPTGRIRCLAARSPGRSMSPLLLSAKFSAQSELNDFLASSALPLQAKNQHDLFFFLLSLSTQQDYLLPVDIPKFGTVFTQTGATYDENT